jgi:hypothetical protein
MKDIYFCDVEDKELLASFRDKLKRWNTCLSDEKDCHSIYNQLINLFWDHTVYRTFNEARRLSIKTNDPSTGLQGTIIKLLDENFVASQATAIRRLTDKDEKVFSLRRLFDEIKENTHLYTRENYVCYDGTSYCDENPINESGLDRERFEADDKRSMRHVRYDFLSEKDEYRRSRGDKISSDVFDRMTKEIKADFRITEEVKTYVDKWVAHAEAPWTRKKHIKVLDKISLHKLDECYQALIRIGKKVELLIDGFLLCSVPTPQFDQLKNWDKPVIIKKDLGSLHKYWDERVKEIEKWDREAEIVHV